MLHVTVVYVRSLPACQSQDIGPPAGRIQRLMQGGYSFFQAATPFWGGGGIQFTKYIFFSGTGRGGGLHTHTPGYGTDQNYILGYRVPVALYHFVSVPGYSIT